MKRNFDRIIFSLLSVLAYSNGNAEENSHLPVKKWEDLAFASHPTGELVLDVFRPSDSKKRPAVLCLHGGFWAKGSKKFMHPLAEDLVARGYVAVSSNYRLTDVAPAPAQLNDVFAAIRFLRENANEYGIDSSKIGVTGSSAGGYLAVMAATFNGGDPIARPNAAVGMGAQTDLTSPHIQNSTVLNWSKFMGGFYHDVPENYASQSPIAHLSPDDPPIAIICGEYDQPSTRANAFRHQAFRLGVPTGLTEIPGAPHGLLRADEHRQVAIQALDNFFEVYLGKGKDGAIPLQIQTNLPEDSPKSISENWTRLGGSYNGCEGAQWVRFPGGLNAPVQIELIFAAHHDGLLYRWNEKRGLRLWVESTPEISAVRPKGSGEEGFYAVAQTTRQLVSLSAQGEVNEILADRLGDKRINRPNDLRIHPRDKSVWITDPNYLFRMRPMESQELPGQYVLRYDPTTKQLTAPIKTLQLPNGIAFDRTGKSLFIGDSKQRKLFRFALNDECELISDTPELVATFPKGLDGVSMDPNNNLWVAGKEGVSIISQNGKSIAHLALPERASSIDFMNDDSGDFHWVAVTTMSFAYVAKFQF